jgi:hypothetical protein
MMSSRARCESFILGAGWKRGQIECGSGHCREAGTAIQATLGSLDLPGQFGFKRVAVTQLASILIGVDSRQLVEPARWD